MRRKGALGPDDIPPTFLKALGPMAKAESLSIFNVRLAGIFEGPVQGWRAARPAFPRIRLRRPGTPGNVGQAVPVILVASRVGM